MAYQWAVGAAPFKLSGKVESGIPKFSLPPFQFEYQNRTIGLIEICGELGSGIIMIPLIAVSANVAIAKAFSELFINYIDKSSNEGNFVQVLERH